MELEKAIKMFKEKIKKQGIVTNAREKEHLERLIEVYERLVKDGQVKEGV